MRRLAILGSTGSIGQSALAVVDAHPTRLSVVALAAGDNSELLSEQIRRYRPRVAALAKSEAVDRLRAACGAGASATLAGGAEGLMAVATCPDADIVICASSGTTALEAVLAAIDAGKTIAIANKEILVMAFQKRLRRATSPPEQRADRNPGLPSHTAVGTLRNCK